MRFFTKLARGLCAGITGIILLAGVLPAFSLAASARTEQVLVGIRGDVNQDQKITPEDVLLLQGMLLTADVQPSAEDVCFSDLNQDEWLDARDLTILKRLLTEDLEPELIYVEQEIPDPDLIPPPITALSPDLPSVGTQKILLVSVDFPDCKDDVPFTTEKIREIAFGEANPEHPNYPLESITAYYDRSSYGRLHLTGDVYHYSAKSSLEMYANYPEYLIDEIVRSLDPVIDYRDYDSDGNYVLDTLLVHLPAAANPELDGDSVWWPCTYKARIMGFFDRVRVSNVCIGSWSLSDHAGFVSTWVHELGHAMGLPDYYYYVNPIGDGDGLWGEAGITMMDDALGDMCAFDKLMLGWYSLDELKIYTGGTMTFTVPSAQHAPGCILIPRGETNGGLSEYYLLEYVTTDVNNCSGVFDGTMLPIMRFDGVRILHCDAELNNGRWGVEFKWDNYGFYYDKTNMKQRVLRLVNSREGGLFREGRTIDGSRTNFAWYNEDGYETVDPGVTIHIDRIADGMCTITVSDGTAA